MCIRDRYPAARRFDKGRTRLRPEWNPPGLFPRRNLFSAALPGIFSGCCERLQQRSFPAKPSPSGTEAGHTGPASFPLRCRFLPGGYWFGRSHPILSLIHISFLPVIILMFLFQSRYIDFADLPAQWIS